MNRVTGGLAELPRGFWPRIVLAWVAVAIVLTVRQLAAIRGFELADPDDHLRLVQVRDLIAGQGWFELFQYRINPPEGVATHWSRLVDIPLLAVILALTPMVGQASAELAAAVIVPLLTLLCAMALTARIAAKLFDARAAYACCMVWIMAIMALTQLQPMRIDHHGWQIVAVLGAINGLLARDATRGGWIVGLSLAAGMSISLELLPFTALFAVVLGLRWLRDPATSGWLKAMMQALALGSGIFYIATRGPTATEVHCDTISPAYLAGFALAALLVSAIAALPKRPVVALAGLLGGAAALTAANYLLLAPQCLSGPFAELDPLVRDVWYVNVFEGMPVWKQNLPTMAQMVIPPLAGLIVLLLAWRQARGLPKQLLGDFALLLGGVLVIAVLVARFSGVAATLATVPLGFAIAEWLRRAKTMPLAARLAILPLTVLAILPGIPVGFAQKALATPMVGSGSGAGDARPLGRGCSLPASLPALRALPPATVFAPFDIGPSLLVHTRHKVIATGHHRASAAMRDVIDAYLADPAKAERIVRAHGASYLVACGDLIEARNYRVFAPKGLMAGLLAGQTPAWLEPVALPAAAGELKVWKVRAAAAQPGRNSIASPFMQ
jgi:hypothetical protein